MDQELLKDVMLIIYFLLTTFPVRYYYYYRRRYRLQETAYVAQNGRTGKWQSHDPSSSRLDLTSSSFFSALEPLMLSLLKWKIMIILKITAMSSFWHCNCCQKLYFISDSVLASILPFQQYALLLSKEHTEFCYLQFWDLRTDSLGGTFMLLMTFRWILTFFHFRDITLTWLS